MTKDDAIRTDILTPNLDTNQRFKIGAAMGLSADAAEQVEFLIKIGVDHILLKFENLFATRRRMRR